MRIAKRMLRGAVTDASPKRLTLELHPAASPVRIVVLPDGDLEVRGETSTLGPGYHRAVLAQLAPVLEELDFVWDADEPEPRAAMAAWFAGELVRGATKIGMPTDRSFVVDAAVQTALGPRDRAWCDAVIADPLRAADAFPWWSDEAGERERSRALCAMWQEIAWREPIDTEERAAMERVDADLRAARKANPALELPWAAWAELLDWLGEDEPRIVELRTRAGGVAAPPIGYRRYPMDVELSGGWSLELPGAFVGAWEDDGARYWATDGDRVIEFTSLSANTEQSSQELLEIAPEKHPVVARISEDRRCGRAEAYLEGEVHIVHGLMTAAPEIAILTCKGASADEAWALAMFRSLKNG